MSSLIPNSRRLSFLVLGLYLLAGSLFTFPNYGGGGLSLPGNIVGWCFISCLIGFGFWQIVRRHRFYYSPLMGWFAAGCLLLCIPELYPNAVELDGAGQRILGLLGGYLFLVALLQQPWRRTTWEQVLTLVLLAISFQEVFALVQYYVLEPGNVFGFNKTENRPSGIFQQVNVMASFTATGLAIALFRIGSGDRLAGANLAFLHAIIFFAGLLLVIIQSRTGQLAGICILALLLPHLVRSSSKAWRSALVVLVLGVIAGLVSMASVEAVRRPSSVYDDPGVRSRVYQETAEMVLENWVAGVGYGRYEAGWRWYHADRAHAQGEPIVSVPFAHPHNETLFWLAEGGVVAGVGLLVLAAGFLRRLTKTSWFKGAALLALPTPILLHTQTEYPLYQSVLHWAVLLLLFAYIDQSIDRPRSVRLRSVALPASVAILVPVLTLSFMGTGLQTLLLLTRFEVSGQQDYGLLERALNPMVDFRRYEWFVMEPRLLEGLAKRDPAILGPYLQWSDGLRKAEPRVPVYFDQVLALRALGETDAADSRLNEALYLFGPVPDLVKLGEPGSHQQVTVPAAR